jgi:hypothetical protein
LLSRHNLRMDKMNKQLTKQAFGVPSIETAGRIDNSDKCAALDAAHYRLSSRMRELEGQFEAKASELREAYLSEVASIHQDEAA